MKNGSIPGLFVLLVLLAVMLTACAALAKNTVSGTRSTAASENTPVAGAATQQTFTDPFTYCAAVGTLDKPDGRYTGPALPDVLMLGYLKASGASPDAAADANFKKMTIWRCMQGRVVVCNFGANLPCDSKANMDKNPTQVMIDFCKENPDSDFIPMAVTGHDVIYSWHCVKGVPELLEQISQVDAAGFLANIWYPVAPGP
jgi:hypothetical protein